MTERNNGPMVKLAGVYENTSKTGRRYFTGYVGACKLLMFEARDAKEGEPGWTLFIQERAPKPAGSNSEGGR